MVKARDRGSSLPPPVEHARSPGRGRRSSWPLLLLAAVTLSSVLVHLNTLSGDFVWDDRKLILDDPVITSWKHVGEIFRSDFFSHDQDDTPYGYYRPVTTASYLWDYTIWGKKPFGYHLTNIVLHTACSALVVLILLTLDLGLTASAIGALLFAVHPIHTENVAWIAGRTDLLAFFFCGIALLLHMQRWRGHLVLSVLAFALALMAKENSVVLVVWLALIHRLLQRDGWRAISLAVAPYLVVLIFYFAWRFLIIGVGIPRVIEQHPLYHVVLSSPPTIVRYVSWMLLPANLNAYVQNPYVTSIFDPRFLLSLVILAGLGALMQRLARRSQRVALTVGMLAVSFAPMLNFVRLAAPADMGSVMAERFCYFPSFPFLALVGLALSTALRRANLSLRYALTAGVVAVFTLGALGTIARNRVWNNELTFLDSTLKQNPTAVLLWANLADYQIEKKNLQAANDALERAAALDPDNYYVLSSRVFWYVVAKRYAEAIPLQERIVSAVRQGHIMALNNLAYLYRMTGQQDGAMSILQQLIRERHGDAEVYFNLAEIYHARGRSDDARPAYRLALEAGPSDLRIARAFAALEEESGRPDEAETIYRRMLTLYPEDVRILNNLAVIRHDKGDMAGALGLLAHVIDLQPDYARARINYAHVLQATGRTAEATAQMDEAMRLATGTEVEAVAAQERAKLQAEIAAAAPTKPETVSATQDVAVGSSGSLNRNGARLLPSAVVLVTVDALRGDFVSFNGHQPQTTPYLDALAEKGVVFTEAYSPSSWTVPSMASLFTSLAPTSHGIVTGFVRGEQVLHQPVLADSLTTLAESFKQAGYVTIGVPGNAHLGDKWGFAQGFDSYATADFYTAPEIDREVLIQLQGAFGLDADTSWKKRKTFLWMHYFDPHDPYTPHEPWISRYAPEFRNDPLIFPATLAMKDLKQRYPTPDRTLAEHIKPLYESEINFFDDHFRWLAERLGLDDDNVLLIVTADHGEEIVDHGSLGHAQSLYQEVIHIPLLVRWPAGLPQGVRIDAPVSLLDIYPTLVELLSLNGPSALQGQSLLPLLRGQRPLTPHVLYFELHPPRPALKAVRDGEWKLIRNETSGQARLYNLASDPQELTDVAAQHQDVAARLQRALNEWLASLPRPTADRKTAPLEDEGVKERLRALGYID